MSKRLKPLNTPQTVQALRILVPEMRQKFGTKLLIKQESLIMKIFGKLLFFNGSFMSSYITVLGKGIYFPSNWEGIIELCEEWIDSDEPVSNFPVSRGSEVKALLGVLFHEYVHQMDNKKNILFPVLYTTPAILGIIGVIGVFVTIWFPKMWFLITALLYAVPLPAYYRSYYESRGYATNVLMRYFLYRFRYDQIDPMEYMPYFKGPAYYWMAGHPWYNKIVSFILRRPYMNKTEAMVATRLIAARETLKQQQPGEQDELEHVYRIIKQAQGYLHVVEKK